MSQFLIIMLVQLLLVLLCVVAGLAFYNYRRRHEEEVGAQMLVYNINTHKDSRVNSLTTLIEKVYGSQGEELKNIVDQLYIKEADCYRELIQVFMNRDPKQLPKMYDAVQKITAAYEGMLLQLNSDSKDQLGLSRNTEYFEKAKMATSTNQSSSTIAPTPDATAATAPNATIQTPAAAASVASAVTPEPSAAAVVSEVSADKTLETVGTEESPASDASLDSSLNYQNQNEKLSTGGMEVTTEESALTTDASLSEENAILAEETKEAPATKPSAAPTEPTAAAPTIIAADLPAEQEMAYYQDKLMTYLESKEVSKANVTQLLDKDNQKEVAKEE